MIGILYQREMVVTQVPSIRSFTIDIEQHVLDDLAQRLAMTRWPERETLGTGLRVYRWRTRSNWPPTGKTNTTGAPENATSTNFHSL